MKFLIYLFIIIILITQVFGYPIIISEQQINHAQAKELVYSIPEEYYKYVDVVEFVNEPRNKWWNWNTFWFLEEKAWYYVDYDYINNKCVRTKIYVYDMEFEYIMHELGHIYYICELKKSYNNEEFAYNFRIQ